MEASKHISIIISCYQVFFLVVLDLECPEGYFQAPDTPGSPGIGVTIVNYGHEHYLFTVRTY